jgi:hypothetical protein
MSRVECCLRGGLVTPLGCRIPGGSGFGSCSGDAGALGAGSGVCCCLMRALVLEVLDVGVDDGTEGEEVVSAVDDGADGEALRCFSRNSRAALRNDP